MQARSPRASYEVLWLTSVYALFNNNSFTNVGGDALEATAGESSTSGGRFNLVFTNNTFNTVGTTTSILSNGVTCQRP